MSLFLLTLRALFIKGCYASLMTVQGLTALAQLATLFKNVYKQEA
jgi:hypothetical protein